MTDWPRFLSALSAKLFDEANELELEILGEDEPERVASRWLGFPGASAEAIATCEASFGVRLPDDYRSFLLASDGFRGMAGLPLGLCSLLPVNEIGWMRDKDATTGRLACYLEERERGEPVTDDFDVDPARYARTLLIGESDGNECILLLPPAAAEAWELWTYHPEDGFSVWETFDAFMSSALEV